MSRHMMILLSTGILLSWCDAVASDLQLRPTTPSVAKYHKIEFDIDLPTRYDKPFDPSVVSVSIVLATPGGRELRIPAFSMQPYEIRNVTRSGRAAMWLYPRELPVWQARFAPDEEGEYTAVAELADDQGTRRSPSVRFTCTESTRKGFVRVSRTDPRFFEFSNGDPFFPIGQNLAFIGESQHVTPVRVPEMFKQLSDSGANFLRIWTCCHDWALAIEARKSAWGRSWNWRPPFVPHPDAEDSRNRCVQLVADSRNVIQVSPSHSVALCPNTDYVLSGRVRVDPQAQFQVRVGTRMLTQPVTFADDQPWQQFTLEFATRDREYWLEDTELRLEGEGSAWLEHLSLQRAGGGPELLWEAEINRPERGFYNPIDCFWLDSIVEAAERNGVYLQLCLITRDAYMGDLKDDTSPEYQQAVTDAKNLLRYAVARWGYSTSVVTWEYFNEIDPGLPLDRFYHEVGEYLERIDVYGHLRGTSTWHRSARDARHPRLDVADIHYYLRPVEPRQYVDEVAAAVGSAAWLREQAPTKPALIAEFGLADEQWRATREMLDSTELADFHNGMWASALSGASGTAMFWWWERLDTRNHYPHYRPLADFLSDIPWTTGQLRPITATVRQSPARVVGLQADDRAYFWLFDPQAAWDPIVLKGHIPIEIHAVQVEIANLAPGRYTVEWWDTRSGQVVRQDEIDLANGSLRLESPSWRRDVACKIVRR